MDASDRRKRAAEEAAEWWDILQGEVGRPQRGQYVDWLRESAVHVAEMLRIAQVHGALDHFERWAHLPTEGSGDAEAAIVRLPTPEQPAKLTRGLPKRIADRFGLLRTLAAAVLLAVGLGVFVIMRTGGQVIQTERGERRAVALADGSVVQIDPQTRLRVAYDDHARCVILEKGRALFHVAKNPNRPFFVQVRHMTVRAIGTTFAVERDPQSIVVTVAEGRVAVFRSQSVSVPDVSRRPGSAQGAGTAPIASTRAHSMGADEPADTNSSLLSGAAPAQTTQILLTANEQVTLNRSGAADLVREVDSGRVLAWAQGKLIFENDSVEYVVHQFNRYNRIQLFVTDTNLARRPISGVFDAADPESFVAFVQSVASVRVRRNDAADITIERAN